MPADGAYLLTARVCSRRMSADGEWGEHRSGHRAPEGETFTEICDALRSNFVFKGIRGDLLNKVVTNMFQRQYACGANIIEQGQQPSKEDCLFYIEVRPSGPMSALVAQPVSCPLSPRQLRLQASYSTRAQR